MKNTETIFIKHLKFNRLQLSILVALLVSVQLTFAKDDSELLQKLSRLIPETWEASIKHKKLIVVKKDEVWAMFENRISGPPNAIYMRESEHHWNERAQRYGRKTIIRAVFIFEKRWTLAQISETIKWNSLILKQINMLPDEYKIKHLYDEPRHKKARSGYRGAKTKEDKKNLRYYNSDKEKLTKLMRQLPYFSYEGYSFFLVKKDGFPSRTRHLAPRKAEEEFYKIDRILRSLK